MEAYYYPYSQAYQFSTGFSYVFASFSKRLQNFNRSITVGYSRNKVTSLNESLTAGFTWSINDYFSVAASRSMDLLTKRTQATTGQIIFQSPSECYQVSLNVSNRIDRGLEISPNLVLNLSGMGYTSVTDPNSANNIATQR
jgi:hypothetical protein